MKYINKPLDDDVHAFIKKAKDSVIDKDGKVGMTWVDWWLSCAERDLGEKYDKDKI